LNIVERFVLSRDLGWTLDEREFAEAVLALADGRKNVYLVLNSDGQYLINRDYIRVRVVKGSGQE
jgi:negative regulator of replication initiation